ncbi:hypothetical protein AMJ87_05605 [candidate division WOR_3 bacterium SM23_60]|uniref:DUF456 domain-containing protein n=1 Tax=candidate division WOR_3 bacterium SM23_60 TaxID=1703780 RepID=A0A0S8GGR6_UNCW3|nr:MAG: hypothetical protein AMJ87_05605 [candidate division WOR_3 bacterium SM23_60]
MSFWEIVLFIVALAIMLVGLAGVILPVLPGIPVIFAGILLYAVVTGFTVITLKLILIFAALAACGLLVDYFSQYFSVKQMGGGRAGAVGAVIGLIIGIILGWIWIVVLPFVFAVVFELIAGRRETQALRAGTGAFLGLLFGGLLRFVIGCVMIGLFVYITLF